MSTYALPDIYTLALSLGQVSSKAFTNGLTITSYMIQACSIRVYVIALLEYIIPDGSIKVREIKPQEQINLLYLMKKFKKPVSFIIQ